MKKSVHVFQIIFLNLKQKINECYHLSYISQKTKKQYDFGWVLQKWVIGKEPFNFIQLFSKLKSSAEDTQSYKLSFTYLGNRNPIKI